MSGMGTVRGGRELGEKCWGNLERDARAAAAGRRARTGCDSPLFFDDIFVSLGQDRAPTRWRLRVRFVRSERLPCEGDEPRVLPGTVDETQFSHHGKRQRNTLTRNMCETTLITLIRRFWIMIILVTFVEYWV